MLSSSLAWRRASSFIRSPGVRSSSLAFRAGTAGTIARRPQYHSNRAFSTNNLKHAQYGSSRTHYGYKGAIGLGLAFIAAWGLVFQSPLHMDATPQLPEDGLVTQSPEFEVDPATSIPFPRTLQFKSPKSPTLTLIGYGVRTVSFLSIQVYTVGFYADLDDAKLDGLAPDKRIERLVQNRTVAIRLVPTRTTSMTHLRDSYVRALQGRLALASASPAPTMANDDEENMQAAIQTFKGFFPNSSFVKHTPFYILLSRPEEEPRPVDLPSLGGHLDHTWLGTSLILTYFSQKPPSPVMKEKVLRGVAAL